MYGIGMYIYCLKPTDGLTLQSPGNKESFRIGFDFIKTSIAFFQCTEHQIRPQSGMQLPIQNTCM